MKNILMYKSKMIKVVTLFFVFTVMSCSNLLDADNPNSLVEGDLSNPAAAGPMVNGSQAAVTRALANILLPAAISADEIFWTGSRDAWQQLNLGQLTDPMNEFTDGAFKYVGEARWWSDEVISRLEAFQDEGILIDGDEAALARAYLYGATIYITIANLYDNFAFSDKSEPAPAIGTANMPKLYDTAIGYLDKALDLGQDDMEGQLQGMKALAYWSKAAWSKSRARSGGTAALINDADAKTAAAAALAAGDVDFVLDVTGSTPDVVGDGSLAFGSEVNDRKEQCFSNLYVVLDPETGNSVNGITTKGVTSTNPAQSIALMDPINNIPDPVIYDAVVAFVTSVLYPDFTVTSAREMHLILAEAALAETPPDMTTFASHINAVRALNAADGLTAWNEATPQIPALDILKHERRVNLFIQGRRLIDHYRFDDPSFFWIPSSDAMTGVAFFPIGITEDRANTEYSGG